ncbi:MAG: phosphoserine phosphatase SerB [Campylobacterales bacterium]
MKLAVFDFDSTLVDGETIDILAQAHGVGEEVAMITHKAMSGELDFFESLTQRVALLKGLSYERMVEICHNLPWVSGAAETISELKKRGMKVVVFSGGFRDATAHGRRVLGYDMDFSNTLHAKDGILTGLVGGEMMFDHSKGVMLQKIQTLLGITPEETMAVGDGANDRSMFAHASVRVAFCAKPALQKEANVIINERDLRHILTIKELGYGS